MSFMFVVADANAFSKLCYSLFSVLPNCWYLGFSVRADAYHVAIGNVQSTGTGDTYLVALAEPVFRSSYILASGETLRRTHISAVRYYGPLNTFEKHNASLARQELEANLLRELEAALRVGGKTLRKEHVTAWERLWRSGVSISPSLAPGTVNGDRLNATIYYLLSQVGLLTTNRIRQLGWHPGGCYNGHHTLQVPTLWTTPSNEASLSTLVRRWFITLSKQGCGPLMQLGAHGVLQAVLLSIGQFLHTRNHLEFGIAPSDLHRNYHFRNLRYVGGTLNVSVAVAEDNRPQLFVAGRGPSAARPLYACDAGCLDNPVRLSTDYLQLPVKLTRPRTALLYVTGDWGHIEDLKHAIHVREIVEAPAHEHHVMAMHKHGHPYGGLPLLFWGALVLLLIVFHLFLAKLIYNEYWRGESVIPPPQHNGTPYTHHRYRAFRT